MLGSPAGDGWFEYHSPDLFALTSELLSLCGVLHFEDRRGFVINYGGAGTTQMVLTLPIPILREAHDTIAHQQSFIQLVRDDDQRVGRRSRSATRRRHVLVMQLEQQFLQVLARGLVERTKRL